MLIAVAGTPGVGKTTFCEEVKNRFDGKERILQVRHINMAEIITQERIYQEWDDDLNCSVFDEEKVIEYLKTEVSSITEANIERMGEQLILLDFHAADVIPKEFVDKCIVLTSSTDVLYDRLKARGYSDEKLKENVEAEIFQVVLDDCKETFGEENVIVIRSDSVGDINTAFSILEGLLNTEGIL